VLAVGGEPNAVFASSWQPQHFEGVPQATSASGVAPYNQTQ
jgi:hypothetical protein